MGLGKIYHQSIYSQVDEAFDEDRKSLAENLKRETETHQWHDRVQYSRSLGSTVRALLSIGTDPAQVMLESRARLGS